MSDKPSRQIVDDTRQHVQQAAREEMKVTAEELVAAANVLADAAVRIENSGVQDAASSAACMITGAKACTILLTIMSEMHNAAPEMEGNVHE